MKYKWIFAGAMVLVLCAMVFIGLAQHDSVMAAQDGSEKIESSLVDQLTAEGKSDYIILMSEQADVSAAARLQTKLEKGQYVFEMLVAQASRTQADLRAYLDGQGASYQSLYIVNAIWVKGGTLELAQSLAMRADVAEINTNHTYQLPEPIDPQLRSAQPNLVEPNISFINADAVWAMGITGQGTVMAGNDTGLDVTHPAIAPHYRGCLNPPTCTSWDHNYNWYDVWDPNNVAPWDDYGHGTHTTGTMVGDDGAGNQIGVAPGAQTIHCKNMLGGSGDDAHFIMCFEWDLAPWDLTGANPDPSMAPDAINNSWGFGGGGNNSMRVVIDNLQAAGILVEVSAGNEGPGCQSLRSPGDYQEVLTTGSVDHTGQVFPGVVTGFSSRGPSSLDGNYFPDIMAPGNGIRSALPGNQYASWSGTSMAGPHATALVGLIWSANPALRGQVAQTIDIIKETAAPLTGQGGSNCGGDYTVGPNNDWGTGTIDALTAVQQAIALGGSGQLDGYVSDAATHNPIEGVQILASRADGFAWNDQTDASGYYTMTIAAGIYTVDAQLYGYLGAEASGVEVVTDTLTTLSFEMTALPTHVVSGHVYETGTGNPLYATVEITDPNVPVPPVTTDPDTGFYSVNVAEGTWHLKASALSHTSEEIQVDVNADMTVDFNLTYLAEWTQISPLPSGCPDFTRFDGEVYNGLVYFLGGRGGASGGDTFGDVYSFNPVANNCTDTGVDMPTPVSNYTIALVNDGAADLLCIFGGRDSAGGYTANYQCYNPVANTASTLGTLPGDLPGFIPGGVITLENKVLVFGGFRNTTAPYHSSQTWEWNPLGNTWTQKGDINMGRGYIDTAVVDGKIYGLGGDTFDGTNLVAQTITEVYDPVAGTWNDAAVADLPQATGEGRAFGFDTSSPYDQAGKIIVAGGGVWPADTIEVFSYDVNSNTYDYSFPDLNTSRRNAAGFFIPGDPGAMWVFGGRSGVDTPPYSLPEFYLVNVVTPQPNIKVTAPPLDVILQPDAQTTLNVTVANIGSLPLDWAIVEDPAAGWLGEAPTSGTINPGDPAQTVVVTFDSAGLTPGVYQTDLLVNSNDPDQPVVTLHVVLTVKPEADLSISKEDAPDPVFAGHPLTYTLTVSDLGPDDAVGVVVTDNLPTGVVFDQASNGCTAVSLVVTCEIGNLAVGSPVTLEIVVIAPSAAGEITNTAIVEGGVVDLVPDNNTASATTMVETEPADLSISKEADPSPVHLGEVLTYTLLVNNLGPNDATGVKMVDNLPEGVTYIHSSPGCARVNLKITCTIGNLGSGEVKELVITVRAPLVEGTLTNTATVSGNEPDPVPGNNTATTNTMVVPPTTDIYLPLVMKQ